MDIKLYNTLSRSVETFTPLKKGAVSMYTCGLTVYDTGHIGNFRSFLLSDLLRRVFEYNGYAVDQVINVTDVDDKTIKRSHAEGKSLSELTGVYEKLWLLGMQSMNNLLPTHIIRATDSIADMITLIQKLLDKGAAYRADDGVYMKVSDVRDYGALARLDASAVSKERVANDEYDKENVRDFALWKFHTPDDGDVAWDAPFGRGRPGWHIECSAMSMKLLGPTIDVHTGGQDLIFPHHTNEIAQSETATGRQFVRYWVHGAFMNVADEKMAKSKGNFVKLETLVDEGVSPLAYRYWLMTAHYRSPVNFTLESVRAAQNALIKLMAAVANLPDGGTVDASYKEKFTGFINDDLDMPKAIALAWELLKDSGVSPADKRATLLDFDRVLGLGLAAAPRVKDEPVPTEIHALVEAREDARKAKDWKKADALRAEIDARGYEIDDTPEGPRVVAK